VATTSPPNVQPTPQTISEIYNFLENLLRKLQNHVEISKKKSARDCESFSPNAFK